MGFPRNSKQAVCRSAVIDIGSNSVRIVVYEGPARAPAVIFNEKVPAGLGRGLTLDGRIAPEDAARGLTALRRYTLLARQMGGDAPLMAGIVALTTVGSAISIPILLTVFHLA